MRSKRPNLGIGVGAIVLFLLSEPALAHANVGLPVVLVSYIGMGVAWIPVVLVEFGVIQRALQEGWWKVLSAVMTANAVSTVLGVPLAWGLWGWLGSLMGTSRGSQTTLDIVTQSFVMWGDDPNRGDYRWMVPCAMLCGLVPAYFASVGIEGFLLKLMLRGVDSKQIWRLSWRANLASYLLLAAVIGARLRMKTV